jgi:hypothetical protein
MNEQEKDEYRALIKRTLQAMDGNVTAAAMSLGIHRTRLSQMLNHKGLVEWWVPYKTRLSLERMRARNRRAHERKRRNHLARQGLDPDLFFKPRKPRHV